MEQVLARPLQRPAPSLTKDPRIQSIDLLRGVVMIIMALDHVRDYFHAASMHIEPTDLEQTNVVFFLTRWITHFCAPVFVFLAGTSAFLSGTRKSRKALSIFLLKRGVWLVIAEITIVSFGWSFNPHFYFTGLAVIWALGISMIVLAALIHLPMKWIVITGIILVGGHNLLDNVHFDGFLWAALHETQVFSLGSEYLVRVSYPVIPWIGLMALGYALGTLYAKGFDPAIRKKLLLYMGFSAIFLFIFLRLFNFYGDPFHWVAMPDPVFTFLSFLNTTKYPPSLLYLLMTIGPSLVCLALTEKRFKGLAMPVITIGRVPMFYYILHLYLLHALAMVAAELSGHSWRDMILTRRTWVDPQLKSYGFSLLATYGVWIVLVLMLYPLCKWYDRYKTNHKDTWWVSYV